MAARLFHALKDESQSLRFVVQEATISLASAYKVCIFLLFGWIYFSLMFFSVTLIVLWLMWKWN